MIYVELNAKPLNAGADALTGHFEPIADALMDLDGVVDPDLALDLDRGVLTFVMGVDTDDPGAAVNAAVTAARTAIHADGGGTPGWERYYITETNTRAEEPVAA